MCKTAALASSSAPAAASTSVTEGAATIYFPSENGVFYNPPQVPNRDLSVLVLHEFAKAWEQEGIEKAAKAKAKAKASAERKAAQAQEANEGEVDGAPSAKPAVDDAAASAEGGDAQPKKLRVLDAMTASGLRAIRYSLEVPQVSQVVANDLEPAALEALRENLRRNGLTEERVVPNLGDAVSVMHRSKPPEGERFEVIELDPYGTAAPFLDSAMQSVSE